MKLYYTITNTYKGVEPAPIGNFLEESTLESSRWYKALPINISESLIGKYIPSTLKLIKHLQKGCLVEGDEASCRTLSNTAFSTAKTCPGLKNVLESCILVKCPCDVEITIDDKGTWVYNTPEKGLLTLTEEHPPSQFGSPFTHKDLQLFKNKRVIKFQLPITLTTEGEPFIHLDPYLHSNRSPLTTVTGVISGAATKGMPLNIITTYDLPETGGLHSISISKGTILAYLWASKPLRLAPYKKKLPFLIHDKFVNSFGREKKGLK